MPAAGASEKLATLPCTIANTNRAALSICANRPVNEVGFVEKFSMLKP
jgi:hypothetical protein